MVLKYLQKNRPGVLALLDPDRISAKQAGPLVRSLCADGLSAVLIGTSFMTTISFDKFVAAVKKACSLPVIIFPGGTNQVSAEADAIFFSSLLSGRNPEYLIGEQARAAFLIREYQLEPIPVGYILIDPGSYTSVEFVSQTRPIPRTKPEIAAAHALAGQYMGMKMIYLEAGSGGKMHVPPEMVREVRKTIDLPLIVGGGIKTEATARKMIAAGADYIVIGSIIERDHAMARRIIRRVKKR
jgi:geranylgeranylglyceryl phosphate synthase family protein